MTKKVGVGQAHSKIILIGEHAVVYGYPAISLPLLEVEVTCKVVLLKARGVFMRRIPCPWRFMLRWSIWISKKPAFDV